jgi:hypothetical protein
MTENHKIIFRLLKRNDIPKFQEFICEHWGKKHIFSHNTQLFDWQHKGKSSYHYMAAFQNDCIVGVQGFIPMQQFDRCLTSDQLFLTLWKAVDNQGNNTGLGLYQHILKEFTPDFISSIGISSDVMPFYQWQRFDSGSMDHHVILSPFLNEFKVAQVPSFKEYIQGNAVNREESHSFSKINKAQLIKLNTDGIYAHQTPIKSDTFIINRYFNHPTYKYSVYALMNDENIDALCIVRPIFIKDSVVLRFVDFIGQNQAFLVLYDYLIEILDQYNAEYIDLYSYGVPLDILKESGFLNRKKINDLVVPNYFEPFKRINIDLNYAFKDLKKNFPVRLFKADCDQDRPN